MVCIEVGHQVGAIGHIDGHIHIEAARSRTGNHHGRSIGEIGELHQFIQLVVGGQRGVAQHVAQIGGRQHFHPTPHPQMVHFALQEAEHIHIAFSEGNALGRFTGVDNLDVIA